ncbi:hypothetical protein [Ovoidimarina sediminis]|uniref:hypothetical protein n=1 Tax=Ovoidimarina sediminis TaxID=3079856 RepID=UPI00290DAB16|nr:hypothetical protein [Rhodophyticola sp. MJ-SS7]MDU8945682.1 hypothetical protein [Rhodophyticola sp. MJ-SS7]
MEDALPFRVGEAWLMTEYTAFAAWDPPIRRRTKFKTIAVFDSENRAISDLALAGQIARRMAKINQCEIEEEPSFVPPTAMFVLACPLQR